MIKTNELTQLDIIEIKLQILMSVIIAIDIGDEDTVIEQLKIFMKSFKERNDKLNEKLMNYLEDNVDE